MKTALAIIGAWFVLAIATAAVLALLREAATQWQARQYRRAWDGTDEGRMSETPLYDQLAVEFAREDLTDESLRRWLS